MIGLVRNEWKKVFLPVLLTTVLLAIAMGVLSCTIYQNYVLHYDLEAWEVGTELFSLLYPLFVVVPLCWNLYYERKNNFLLYIMPRVKIKKYLTAKWIAYALGTLCIIVIPYILSAVFALYVKPPVVPFVENPFSHIFENAFIKTPLLYAVALSLWRGIVSLFVYLLAAFVEHTVNGQSIFISVRAKSRRHLVKGILSVSTKFLIIYAFFWLMAGLIGASLFSTGLTIVSFRLMLYAVLMKCLDILVQYLIVLGIYIATRQVTIGFLVLVAGNLLCILPGNWVAYSPFGLSSLTRISVVEPGIGISAVSAFGIEAAILTLMIAGILMWGYKKILN